MCGVSIHRTIIQRLHFIRNTKVTPICYSPGLWEYCWEIIWQPHPDWSGRWFPFQVTNQCRRPKGYSTLPPSLFQSHNGPQRGIPQGIHQLLPWTWIPFCSQTERKVQKGRFYCPISLLQTSLDCPPGKRYIFSWPFHSHLIPKISNILQKCTLTQLCLY